MLARYGRRVCGDKQLVVMNGPFKGMAYASMAHGSQLLPKLLGSYEEPIHQWIHQIMHGGTYQSIIDVGCAEGYYAVGFSMAPSKPVVHAFDVNEQALAEARELARLNEVGNNLHFHNLFERSSLQAVLSASPGGKALLFMDVEGAERELIDPVAIPELAEVDILVELHDCFLPGLTEEIVCRLSASHRIDIIVDYPWREAAYTCADPSLDADDLQQIMNEVRPDHMRWLLARTKSCA